MSALSLIRLELGELEAMRLCDLERLDQEEAALRMKVSRGTVQRLIKKGRAKVVEALVTPAALLIEEEAHHESRHPHRG